MKNYIYCYTNLVNGKKYVGQTNSLERRKKEHSSNAFNEKSVNYDNIIHKAIRKYGLENFKIDILEVMVDKSSKDVDQAEAKWIQAEQSLVSQHGYNIVDGGNSCSWKSMFSKEQIEDIQQLIKVGTPYNDIASKYGVSKAFISSINTGLYFHDDDILYPLCNYRIDNDVYDLLVEDLRKPELSFRKLAEKYQMAESTVKKFNYGKLRPGYVEHYPIRLISPADFKAERIQYYLLETTLTKFEIKDILQVSDETIRRINLGITHYNKEYKYPLRQTL